MRHHWSIIIQDKWGSSFLLHTGYNLAMLHIGVYYIGQITTNGAPRYVQVTFFRVRTDLRETFVWVGHMSNGHLTG